MESRDDLEEITPHHLIKMMAALSAQLEYASKTEKIVDIHGDDTGSAGYVNITNHFRKPFVATHILATWANTATSVALQIGEREFQLIPANGYFSAEGKFQIAPHDKLLLTTNGVASHLEIMGYVDERRNDL